ncbi:hypothetical protein FAVG1_04508 [Fusarium avenaceum]|nr:hypothetical protein FAVG1_04508 [Fusarium avenaceum]
MAPAKLNVLVYTGLGTTVESVRHCIWSLRRLLGPNYAVIPITETIVLKEPWQATCALLVFPGGGDLGYCQALNGEGNRRISDYVRRGGSYLGFCAGGYYGSQKCEFEVGNKPMEVIGRRELGFFPGTCRGGAFKGFEYKSEGGARAVRLTVPKGAFEQEVACEIISYYNGGGIFVDAASVKQRKVEILATYDEETDVDGGEGNAAVVLCTVGDGKALLTGPHPEFAAANLNPQPSLPGYDELVSQLAAADKDRASFLKGCLTKLGLEVSPNDAGVPSLSRLHLSSITDTGVSELLSDWSDIIDKENGEEWIRAETDTFHIQNEDTIWSLEGLQQSLAETSVPNISANGSIDYSKIVKKIVPHEKGLPHPKLTPHFNHGLFFSSLKRYREIEPTARNWGNLLMYGEVVTSTNTMLEKNPKLMPKLPSGFTVSATTQVAGRGRGSNVWIAPPGMLIFSTVLNHPAHLAVTRPIVFLQYIAAIAIVEAVQSYDRGYENIPIKLKWPNDIYALDPTKSQEKPHYSKVGGILSQCLYFDGNYQIILGIGLNTTNSRPTMSISDLVPAGAPELHLETLLARVLTRIEAIYAQFLREGFSSGLEARYYSHWLHTKQEVTLEAEGGVKARVKNDATQPQSTHQTMESRQFQDTDRSEKVSQPQNENHVDKTSSKSIFTTITLFNLPHRTQVPSFPTLDETSTNRIITLWSETPTTHSVVRAWYTRIQTVFFTEIDGEIQTLDSDPLETSTGSETQETSTGSETSVVEKTTTTSETTTTPTIVSETLLSSTLPSTSSEVLVPSSTWSTSYTTTSSSEIWSTLTLTVVPSDSSTTDSNGISPAEGVGISVGACGEYILPLMDALFSAIPPDLLHPIHLPSKSILRQYSMPVLFPNFDRTNTQARYRSSLTMQDQKDTPLEEALEATYPQHEARNLEDDGGDEGAASPNIRNRPSESSPNSDISISSEAPTDTDETHHVTSTILLTVTEALTLVVVDHSAWYTLTATLDGGSEVPTSSTEVPTLSSDILSFIHRIPLFNTRTMDDTMSPPKAWITSYTSQSLPAMPTATVTETSSAKP